MSVRFMRWSVWSLLLIGTARAEELERLDSSSAIVVSPIRVAAYDAQRGVIGEWIDYGGTGAADDCGSCQNVCYDGFGLYDRDLCGFHDPCGLGNTRWFFGPSYCSAPVADDMRLVSGCGAKSWERVVIAWYWYCGGGGEEHCYILVDTAEDFGFPCGETALSGRNAGLVLDFGILTCDPGSYYFVDLDLCAWGLDLKLPQDGDGAFTLTMAKQVEPELQLATCGQFMLWGPSDLEHGSTRAEARYDGDGDGEFEAGECSDFDSDVCPDPLGYAVSFFGEPATCTGGERIKKARCRLGAGKVVLIGGAPGQGFCVTLDSSRDDCGTVNNEGKGRAKFAGLSSGAHQVQSEWDCGATAETSVQCP